VGLGECPLTFVYLRITINDVPKDVFAMRLAAPIREALETAARRDMRPPTQLAAKILAEHLIREGFLSAEEVKGKQPRHGKRRK
jgi:hypothetical protein